MAYLIADLKALTTNPEPLFKSVMALGLTAIDDGGGGIYHWNAVATNAGDNAEWVVPNDNPTTGRWQRIARNVESYLATVNLATDTTGTLAIASGGTGNTTAANAFAALKQVATTTATGVVELATSAETTAGLAIQASDTRLHIPVTVSGTPNYVTLSGQDLVRALVNLASHVTGTLPFASVAGRTVVTEAGTTHTNAATDRDKWIRFTGGSAKTWTIASGVAAATEVWMFLNVGAGNLSLVGSGVTLTGNLIFAPLNGGFIYFTSTSAADVIGGTAT